MDRLERQIGEPSSYRLQRALSRLGSVLTAMNTGAHPDDESSALLAALRFAFGFRTVILCATRGEGGQNAIGPERGGALGALRSRELEVAAERIDAEVVWLSERPNDVIHDFGFSKSGDDAVARWGWRRLVERFVKALRVEQPDILLPTFLDVPGQHGHHRAMTRAALAAVPLAADAAAFPEHLRDGLAPWSVQKLYLPAWSGAGAAYDDEEPPPPTTLKVNVPGPDPASGASWGQLGEWSRAAHASQGMGRWVEPAPGLWPLHLAWRSDGVAGVETDIRDGLLATVGDLARIPGTSQPVGKALLRAQSAIEAAQAAYPDRAAIRHAADAARRAIEEALSGAPREVEAAIGGRLRRKLLDLRKVESAAAGEEPEAPRRAPLAAAPTVRMTPDAWILDPAAPTSFAVTAAASDGSVVTLAPPPGWRVETVGPDGYRLSPPAGLSAGLYEVPAFIGGRQALAETVMDYPHVGRVRYRHAESLRVLAASVALPIGARIAYLGGGADCVDLWLRRLGLDVATLSETMFAEADLSSFTTVVVGASAFGVRDDLLAGVARLRDFVEAGGHLLTLCQRPADRWDGAVDPLRRIRIGQPSLRWRVTDPAATVTHLAPDHPLLTYPNRIDARDWEGWDKERGLYFAAEWDPAYEPLLSMADPGEAPLIGGLISARIGKGRHTHTGLALPHQLDRLNAGALRLIANLVQPA